MRELYYDDPEKYSKYGHVDIVILPHSTEKDIDELEAQLQIRPDIKEDYTWIAKACMLRARQDTHHYTNAQLATLYNISEKEIVAILAQLGLVDEYLGGKGRAKQYASVEKSDYTFKQLYKGLQQLRQPGEKDLLTGLAFCLIDNGNAVEGRLYERIPEVKDNLLMIAERLTALLPIEPQSSASNAGYDLFSAVSDESNYQGLVEAVGRTENRATVIDAIVDVVESQKEKGKKADKADAVLRQVIEANTRLQNAINYVNEETAKTGIEQQLKAIEKSISAIRKWLATNA